jgi:hypothetical protein
MSPVEQGPKINARAAIVVGIAGVIGGIGLFVLVSFLSGRGDVVEVRLGDETFQDLDADRISEEIDDRGPILFPDLLGGSRTIYLQHLGDDPAEEWYAFDAFQPGAGPECLLRWESSEAVFVDPCDGTSFPADGKGLPQYPATVTDGRVSVDLNAAFRTTTTSTTTTTTSTTVPVRGQVPD